MKKEVNSVLGILIIVVVSALIGLLAMFIISNKNIIKDNTSNESNNNNEIKYEKIDNIDTIAKEFFDNFISDNRLLFLNYNNVFKNGNKFNVSDLTLDERMSIIYSYTYNDWKQVTDYTNANESTVVKEISTDEFKKYYLKLFGSLNYENIGWTNSFGWCYDFRNIKYNKDENKFQALYNIGGCGAGPYSEKYLYDKVKQEENKIKLYAKVGYASPDTTHVTVDVNKIILYSDHEMKNIVATNVNLDDLSPYKDKLNTLIYTLVKDNDNYVLESIEVVK